MAKQVSKSIMDKQKESFRKAYPGKDLYFTTDGNCWLKKAQAEAHARKEKLEVIEDLTEKPKAKEDTGEMTEDQAKETLQGLELNDKADYKLLGQLVDVLGLEPEGKSKEDYIKVLEPVQKDLQEA